MSRKKSVPAKASATPPTATEDEKRKFAYAQAVVRPSTLAGNTIAALKFAEDQTDVVSLTIALREQQALVTGKNDLSRAEAMLIAQAHVLDALFNRELMTAMRQDALPQFEAHAKLAMRAQSQCRATLETLATIKNPPNPTFIRQANVAHGPQQVNNGVPAPTGAARAQESENRQTELLEHTDGNCLDPRAASTASGADPAMAALGTGDGTANRRRQGP